jgi:hypothetical protein
MNKIGVGKESDIYLCVNEHGDTVVLKLARLGRQSFRSIKNNRDYIKHRSSYNWLYLSRLSSIKEYTFMEILHKVKKKKSLYYYLSEVSLFLNIEWFPDTRAQGLESPCNCNESC